MNFSGYPFLLALLLSIQSLSAVMIVVDDFNEGNLSLSLSGTTSGSSVVTGGLGTVRSARIRARNSLAGTTLTSQLLGMNGYGAFALDEAGALPSTPAPGLHLAYGGAGSHSILGTSGFELDFGNVQGSGFLLVEVGGETVKTANSLRVPITRSGTIWVPLEMVNLGRGGSLGAFSALHFDFHAQTTEFSFLLDQIRVVPEPSALLLLALSWPLLLGRRRSGR